MYAEENNRCLKYKVVRVKKAKTAMFFFPDIFTEK